MRSFKIGIAGKIVEINAVFSRLYNICRNYIAEGDPIISLGCTMSDFDRAAILYEKTNKLPAPCDVYLEEYAMLDKLSNALIDYNILLIHGAAVCYNNAAYLFTGRSGIGKTTHALKWIENKPEAFIINGDKSFIRVFENGQQPLICGSPWNGKENLGTNVMVPLKAIVILSRADNNCITPISYRDAFTSIYSQIYRPVETNKMRKTLTMLKSLEESIQFFDFEINNFEEDCFPIAFNALADIKES